MPYKLCNIIRCYNNVVDNQDLCSQHIAQPISYKTYARICSYGKCVNRVYGEKLECEEHLPEKIKLARLNSAIEAYENVQIRMASLSEQFKKLKETEVALLYEGADRRRHIAELMREGQAAKSKTRAYVKNEVGLFIGEFDK